MNGGIRRISSGSGFEALAGYSRAVVVETADWLEVLVSGCTGFDYATMTIAEDVGAQTRQAFANVAAALAEAGGGLEHLVRVRIYLTNQADFEIVAPIVGEYCRAAGPANTTLVCGLADPRMKVEVEADARIAPPPPVPPDPSPVGARGEPLFGTAAMNLMFQPLKNYAAFEGRARRKEFWLFVVLLMVVQAAAAIPDMILFDDPQFQPFATVAALALFVPYLAVAFRRLHDTDRSGWWLLLALLPIVGWIALLIFYVLPGTLGPNRFGPDPKAAPTEETISAATI